MSIQNNVKRLRKGLLWGTCCSLVINLLLLIYEKITNTQFFLRGINSGELHWFLGIISICLLIVWFFIHARHKIAAAVFSCLIFVAVFYVFGMTYLFTQTHTYFQISSPDAKYSVVLTLDGKIYQSKNLLFIQPVRTLHYIGTETPSFDSRYQIEWEENKAILFCQNPDDSNAEPIIVTVYF